MPALTALTALAILAATFSASGGIADAHRPLVSVTHPLVVSTPTPHAQKPKCRKSQHHCGPKRRVTPSHP